jgi:hypothetical protein
MDHHSRLLGDWYHPDMADGADKVCSGLGLRASRTPPFSAAPARGTRKCGSRSEDTPDTAGASRTEAGMMPTNWVFWLNASLSLFGLLIILYGAVAKRNPRGKRFDKQTRLLIILTGFYVIVVSISVALADSGWRFPYDSIVEGMLALLTLSLAFLVLAIVMERRNYARAIAAQNAQTSLETDEEPE